MSRDDAGLGALKSGLAVFSRLFDHRAILQESQSTDYLCARYRNEVRNPIIVRRLGEARYFIEEFQNKRKGCETAKLAECQRMIEKHCSATLPDAAASADANLALLDKRVLELTKLCDLIMPDSIEPAYTGHCAPNTRPPSPGHDTEWDTFMQSIEQEKQMVDAHFNSEVEQYRIFLEKHGPPIRDDGGGGFGRKGYTKI